MFLRFLILISLFFTNCDGVFCQSKNKKIKKTEIAKTKKKLTEETENNENSNILQPYGLAVNAVHALIVDHKSKQVLLEKNTDQVLEPASLTKIMTAYMVMRAIKQGRIKETDLVNISKNAQSMEGSSMFLEAGMQVPVIELLKGILVVSGNDASVAMAEFLGGTEQNFAEEMTRVAKEIGCNNTSFKNSSGLPAEGHYTTAKDLITMAIRLFEDFPEYYYINKQTEYTFNKIKQQNRNTLLNKNMGCDGIKTGFTEAAGYCVVSSGEQNGRRLFWICTGLRSKQKRADENLKFLQWGFQTFAHYTIFPKDKEIIEIPVKYGDKDFVSIEPEEHIINLNRSKVDQLKAKIKYISSLKAPIKKGDCVGEISVKHPEWNSDLTIKLIAKENIEDAFFLKKIGQFINYTFWNKKNTIN